MVTARRDFLDRGYFLPVREAVLAAALPRLPDGSVVLDVGCGEGWYTAGLAEALERRGVRAELYGVDISRDALKMAAARRKDLRLAAASAARLPLEDGAADLMLNLFSPLEAAEYRRVLRAGGVLLRAVPLERHLWSLKAAVYDRPYENDVPDPALEGFVLKESRDIETVIRLETQEDVRNLFRMTPYWYKTGAADQAKLERIERLDTELAVRLLTYEKA